MCGGRRAAEPVSLDRSALPVAASGTGETHPGEMLREDFLPDYALTVSSLATAAGVSRQSVNELLRCRRAVSPAMALRLAKLFGNSADVWLNAQRAVDLWDAAQHVKGEVARSKPLRVA